MRCRRIALCGGNHRSALGTGSRSWSNLRRGVAEQAQANILRSFGALNVSHSLLRRFAVVQVPEGTVAAKIALLMKDPSVERATPNYVMHLYFTPNDPYYNVQWNLPLINIESAWDISTGAGVTVAVVDTGINTSPHFNARRLRQPAAQGL